MATILLDLSKDEDFIRQFQAEARAAGQFNHPNVVQVHDAGREGQTYYIIMEYVEGKDVLRYCDDLRLSVADRLRLLRVHGSRERDHHLEIGTNSRLDALQAAIVAVKLDYLDVWTAARQDNAARYRDLFASAGLTDRVVLPVEKENRHIYNQFVIRVETGRDDLRAYLGEQGVGTEVYYPVPMHLQECFSSLGHQTGDFPIAEQAADHTLAIPVYPELSESQQAYVVEKIGVFLNR